MDSPGVVVSSVRPYGAVTGPIARSGVLGGRAYRALHVGIAIDDEHFHLGDRGRGWLALMNAATSRPVNRSITSVKRPSRTRRWARWKVRDDCPKLLRVALLGYMNSRQEPSLATARSASFNLTPVP